MLTNARARPGDVLILTKALGTGIVGTATKFGRAPAALVEQAVQSMTTLNKAAAEAVRGIDGVHACTDVTGFGLLGHGCEMAAASGVTLRFEPKALPLFDGVRDLVSANRSGGLKSNQSHFGGTVQVGPDTSPDVVELAYDPQTSGGLLLTVDAAVADQALAALHRQGVAVAAFVGTVSVQGPNLATLG
jgi:selenide,water dikinase